MPTIAMHFTAGCYHATPWGRHVNEGDVEWPPAPWRLLRALMAVGFNKLGWVELPPDACALFERLAEVLPLYRLPPGQVTHSRHYMPIIEGKNQKTTKVIDAFIRLDSKTTPLLIHLPVCPPPNELSILKELVDNLAYFGRAESWVNAEMIDDPPSFDHESWCKPCCDPDEPIPLDQEQVPLLAPITPEAFQAWRAMALGKAENLANTKGKKTSNAVKKLYPAGILECLMAETNRLQAAGWSRPPGSRQILYTRHVGCLQPKAPSPVTRYKPRATVQAALLALASDTNLGNLLPLRERTLPQAELIHQSLVSVLGDSALSCPAITGRNADGTPLQGHQHAHFIPLDLNEDGRIDHFIIHAPMGLDPLAVQAIQQVRKTWTKGDDRDIFVTCAGIGDLQLFAKQIISRSGRPISELAFAKNWVSVTPFIPPRHIKKRRHSLDDQIRAELASRNLPEPSQIELFSPHELVTHGFLKYVRKRKPGKPQPPNTCVFGLRISFPEAVSGPIVIGYGAHFGLGLFEESPISPGL